MHSNMFAKTVSDGNRIYKLLPACLHLHQVRLSWLFFKIYRSYGFTYLITNTELSMFTNTTQYFIKVKTIYAQTIEIFANKVGILTQSTATGQTTFWYFCFYFWFSPSHIFCTPRAIDNAPHTKAGKEFHTLCSYSRMVKHGRITK